MIFHEVSVLWAIVLTVFSVLAVYISGYALQRRYVGGAGELAFFLLTVAFYSMGSAFEINGTVLPRVLDFIKFEFFWASFTAPAFLLFALRYHRERHLPLAAYVVLLAGALLLGVLGMTPEEHRLVYRSYGMAEGDYFPEFVYVGGPFYYVQLTYLIGCSLVGEAVLLLKALRSRGKLRTQALLISVGGTIPTLNTIIFPQRNAVMDTQPLALIVMGCFIAVSLFRYQMLDLLRIARDSAVDTIGEYLVVLDRDKVILDINRSGRESALLAGFKISGILKSCGEFGLYLDRIMSAEEEGQAFESQTYSYDDQHFEIRIRRLKGRTQSFGTGYTLLIHDITRTVRLMDKLEIQATVDPLTSVYNRRQWMNLASRELEIHRRSTSPCALIIFDLDHFKKINDGCGHLFGDEVLKAVAATVKKELRISEIFGRYGGEEFCVFCPQTDLEAGRLVAERIRRSIEDLNLSSGGVSVPVTASLGIYSPGPGDVLSIDSCLNYADMALYRAKNEGRNRSVCYTPLQPA